MHTNMSLYDLKTGKNVFDDPNGELGLSKEAYSFIAGIMAHVKGIAVFSNPTVNSYKRLVPGYEAPVYIAWSATNRSPLIRIPAASGEYRRMELRSPDCTANPYIAFALLIWAGLDGLKNKMPLPEKANVNLFTADPTEVKDIETLPLTLSEAMRRAENSSFIRAHLPESLIAYFCEQ